MELPTTIAENLKVDEQGFLCFRGWQYLQQIHSLPTQKGLELLAKIIDDMGQLSAVAQRLGRIITSSASFFGSEHRIYIKTEGCKVLGFIRVGEKHLFHCDRVG